MTGLSTHFGRFWTANSSVILRLVLPLGLLSILFLVIASPDSPADLALNLATDLLTIIVTVLYVDWVVKEHEHAAWKGVEKYIAAEAGRAAHSFISDMAVGLDLEGQLFPSPAPSNAVEIQQNVLRNAAALDRFAIEDALARLDKIHWALLMQKVSSRRADTAPLVSQFGARMAPNQLAAILAFRELTSSIVTYYDLMQDFLAVPITALPKVKGGRPEEYMVLTIIQLGIDLKAAIDAALTVVDTFSFRLEQPNLYEDETNASWKRWYERSRSAKKRAR